MSSSKTSSKHNSKSHTKSGGAADVDSTDAVLLADGTSSTSTTTTTTTTADDIDTVGARDLTPAVGGAVSGSRLTAVSGARTDAEREGYMIRAEERLVVGKEQVGAGKATLDKFVTTEHAYASVPVMKEHAVLHTEPITDADNISVGRIGIAPAHFEMALREEHAVAGKKAVAVEKISLKKEVEQGTETVGAQLQKEQVEYRETDEANKGRVVSTYSSSTGKELE